jgi:putative glycosyltransferase (TIGR04348 family)
MAKPHIVIISPYLSNANNGNWQTARRWSRFLQGHYKTTLGLEWDNTDCDVMIALHARRSASSIAAFAQVFPARPLVVALTGTDLYRDIASDVAAQRSLQLATKLLILQPAGLQVLDKKYHAKTEVIYQSAPALKPFNTQPPRQSRYFDVIMVGHLREEKDPAAFMRASGLVSADRVRLIHIGGALDPDLASQAEDTQKHSRRYQWLGNVAHAATRQRLKRSQLMVITSRMEGGANVIIEAVTSGVPVLASDISGNRGMLGEDYAGYFPCGDSKKLARMIDRASADPAFYRRLQTQCNMRAHLFTPERERATLLNIIEGCISHRQDKL